ncbi:hypothetical protein GMDG_03853 [Pseudogymnoascus destructans 20631-21]|uniref:Uncharacterized protein n=1 Tax=Pseudogymnoascus destructans (strain ATCC MYA-4855 / 20631-21) TaxID=658429 RepID=L8G7S5_PSED2|nr:hypothetical protein GMDG_03853 [Pseudogymnoascus destructans 20631-21]
MDDGLGVDLTRYFLLEAPKVAFELQTTVSAADFELEASVGEEDDDEDDQAPLVKRTKDTTEGASDDAMESTSTRYALSKTDFGEKETTGDSGSTAIQGQSPGPSSRTGEGDNDSSAPLIQEQFTNPAIRTAASDLEAANDSQDNDPLMSARFLRFKVIFDYFDTALLGIGCILHVLGLPRLHPPLPGEQHLLHWRLELSKSPRFHAFDDRRLVHHNGSELLRHVPAIPPGLGPWSRFLAMGKPLWLSPQAFVRGWMDRHPTIQNIVAIVSTTVDRWAQKAMVTLFVLMDRNSFVFAIVMIVTVGPCLLALFLVWSTITVFIAQFLWSEYMIWVYELVSAEFVVLPIFGLICFVARVWLKGVVGKVFPTDERFEASLYLDEMGVTLLTGVLISFVVSALWYGFRYPYFEVGKWRDSWR